MPRLARAAKQLLNQVPDGTPVGDPDGFGVLRSVVFPAFRGWEDLGDDSRVRSVVALDGRVFVTFVAGTAADRTEAFDLE